MLYRRFGQTDKKVSALGFGGMRFRAEDYVNAQGREKCAALLVKANELGINYFDTAPGYCGGHSEEIFGMAFPQMRRQFYVSTKSKLSDDPTADAVRRRIEGSLEKMKIEKIHFYHMWCILNLEQYEQIMRKGGPYEGALRAKEEGLIDHLCFSSHCDGKEVEKIINDNVFEGVTMGYNVINSGFREEGMQAAYKKGMGVVTMNSLGGGVIPEHPEYFSYLKQNEEDNIIQAALRYNAAHRAVSVVLSGMATEEELLENVGSFENFEPEETYFNEVNRKRNIGMNDLCTGCNYCAGCPKQLEIHKLMQAYNEYIFSHENQWKLLHELSHKWGFRENATYDCIQCGRCEGKCTQKLPIIERISTINTQVLDYTQKVKDKMDRYFGDRDVIKVGIYGIGSLAGEMYDLYQWCYPDDFDNVFLFDKNEKKWGTAPFYREWKINAPNDIERLGIKRIVVCNQFYYQEIYKELQYLEKLGVEIMQYQI